MLSPIEETMNNFIRDLRYAVRTLGKTPGTVLAIVLTLGLAIGANTAVFSMVNAVLLRPLPYPEPERLVYMAGWAATPANLESWKEDTGLFKQISHVDLTRNLTMISDTGYPQGVRGFRVSADFFPMLGIRPQLGRWFTPDEERTGAESVAIISDALWKRSFASSPDVIGQAITLSGNSFTVIGVVPPGFQYMRYRGIDLWLPPAARDEIGMALGRLETEVTLESARARMETLTAPIEPATERVRYFARELNMPPILLESLTAQVVSNAGTQLWVLFGVVMSVLLIGCANIANLLLARALGKQRDTAIRFALGATRRRLVAQSLTETLLLFLMGGTLGFLLSVMSVTSLAGLAPSNFPRLHEVRVDSTVLLYAFLLTTVSGLVFGLIPAMRTTRVNISQTLAGATTRATSGARHRRLRNSLVIGEVALALILLTGAGLLIRTFLFLQPVDPGFDPENKMTFRLAIDKERYPTATEQRAFLSQLLIELRALPAAESVAAINQIPMSGFISPALVTSVEGNPIPPEDRKRALLHWVTPNYLQTMRIPLVRGRELTEADSQGARPVAIVSRKFAERYFPDTPGVGAQFAMQDFSGQLDYTVVGVVEDARYTGYNRKIWPEVYVPIDQWETWLQMISVVIQTRPGPHNLASEVRDAVRSVDPTRPVSGLSSMEDLLSRSVIYSRSRAQLMGLFSALALVLAVVGIYGVLSYTVSERTHEMGIRIALGAKPGDIVKLVLRGGMALVLTGIGLGLAGSWALTRVLKHQLQGVTATDPLTFVAVAGLLLLVALLACWIPARRAMRVDPMVALRYE